MPEGYRQRRRAHSLELAAPARWVPQEAVAFPGGLTADLSVQPSNEFDLVINLKTAKSPDLPVRATLLAQANEMIE